jgi:hypothetical protein
MDGKIMGCLVHVAVVRKISGIVLMMVLQMVKVITMGFIKLRFLQVIITAITAQLLSSLAKNDQIIHSIKLNPQNSDKIPTIEHLPKDYSGRVQT